MTTTLVLQWRRAAAFTQDPTSAVAVVVGPPGVAGATGAPGAVGPKGDPGPTTSDFDGGTI